MGHAPVASHTASIRMTSELLLPAAEPDDVAPDPEASDATAFGPAIVLNDLAIGRAAAAAAELAGDGDEPQGDEQGAGRRKTLTRFCVSRVLWKLALAVLLYVAYTRLDMVQHLEDASAYIETLPPNTAICVFLLMSTSFTALSPTGYLPTVLAGIVFHDRPTAWAVAYIQVNLGALLNAALVRQLCRPLAQRMTRRRFGTFHWLNNALRQPGHTPVKIVALIRTPFLWGGFFNYLFALSDVYGAPFSPPLNRLHYTRYAPSAPAVAPAARSSQLVRKRREKR